MRERTSKRAVTMITGVRVRLRILPQTCPGRASPGRGQRHRNHLVGEAAQIGLSGHVQSDYGHIVAISPTRLISHPREACTSGTLVQLSSATIFSPLTPPKRLL